MLYLIEILHQTTTPLLLLVLLSRCILSKFYIKPQLVRNYYSYSQVVSYRNSTSNHNQGTAEGCGHHVVSYRNSTSNHNPTSLRRLTTLLYLIEILHQTTTPALLLAALVGCILSKFYIKPQLLRPHLHFVLCCILSKFYIKPQHMPFPGFRGGCCILSKFYIKPQRNQRYHAWRFRCILSKFYIKPQLNNTKYKESTGCILSKFYIKPQRRASY